MAKLYIYETHYVRVIFNKDENTAITIKELLELLKKYPEDTKLSIPCMGSNDCMPVTALQYIKDDNELYLYSDCLEHTLNKKELENAVEYIG